jgi:hypothetical protein
MGRANNVSRSLQIISRMQGWDPCKIDGEHFAHLEYDENERQQGFRPGPAPTSPQSIQRTQSPPGPDTRGPGPGGTNHGHHNPMAGK